MDRCSIEASGTRAGWGSEEPTALDLELLRLVYSWTAAATRCSRCGAPLHRPLRVETWPTLRHEVRWRVAARTRCSGWRRHAHVAVVARSGDDVVLGPLEAGR